MFGKVRRSFSRWRQRGHEHRQPTPHHDAARPKKGVDADRRAMDFGRITTGSLGGAWDDPTEPVARRKKRS